MTRRAASIRNRLLVAAVATLLAWFFGWTSDEGLLMLLVAVVAATLALMRIWFGGFAVLMAWLFRYRHVDIGVRELGNIIGEHHDDMQRAGLVVSRRPRPTLFSWRRRPRGRMPRQLPDLVPRLRHRPYDGGIVISLEAVRAGMSQDDLIDAVPRLRSAWGVDQVHAQAKPGGRLVEFTIPMTDDARRALQHESVEINEQISELEPESPSAPRQRPPDAPTVTVVQGGRSAAAPSRRPPTIQPQLQPDERGRYELTMLPEDAASSYSPHRVDDPDDIERNPSTDEIPIIQPGSRPRSTTSSRPPSVSPGSQPGGGRNPTDIDERDLRIGLHWRTGKER